MMKRESKREVKVNMLNKWHPAGKVLKKNQEKKKVQIETQFLLQKCDFCHGFSSRHGATHDTCCRQFEDK